MIVLLILTPIIGAFHILITQDPNPVSQSYGPKEGTGGGIKMLSITYTIITLLISLVICFIFNHNDDQMITYSVFTSSLFNLEFGIDGLSLVFIILTTITIPICVLASWSSLPKGSNLKYYHIMLLIFETFTLLVWVSTDLFIFYVSFEAVLVPLFLIIGMYSMGPGKVRAAFLLFLYTFTGSLFILLGFSALYYYTGTSSIGLLSNLSIDYNLQYYVFLGVFLSIAIKTPIVPFHNWILRAHVEAPVAGSMVLAGLTLKMAIYGMLRILLPILPEASVTFAPIVNTLAIISIIYASLAAIRQSDIKCLIAYTSVAHIGVCVLGAFSFTFTGIIGSIVLSLAHGFTSPALFFIVGGVLYDRFHTRTIKYMRGLISYIPITITILFLATLSNAGTPATGNWIGELYSLTGAFISNPYVGAIGASTIFLSSIYSFWTFNRVAGGSYSPYLKYSNDLTRREFVVLVSLLFPILVLGIYPNFVYSVLQSNVSILLFSGNF